MPVDTVSLQGGLIVGWDDGWVNHETDLAPLGAKLERLGGRLVSGPEGAVLPGTRLPFRVRCLSGDVNRRNGPMGPFRCPYPWIRI